jgi:protein-L-isoaspartate(D-aspartate) O-methyltransferase
MTDLAQPTVSAADLRARLADALIAAGFITTPSVEAAVRRVPREVFVPDGTDLAAAYANNIVVTKRGPDGKTTSSISAPWLSLSTLIVLRSLRAGERVPPISESLIATSGDCYPEESGSRKLGGRSGRLVGGVGG